MLKKLKNELLDTIIEAADEKKGERITAIDLRQVDGSICDWFVICSAQSTVAVDAISDNIEDLVFERMHQRPSRIHGRENSMWIAMDYSDVMVHIFLNESREFYKLEELWGDCPTTIITSEE